MTPSNCKARGCSGHITFIKRITTNIPQSCMTRQVSAPEGEQKNEQCALGHCQKEGCHCKVIVLTSVLSVIPTGRATIALSQGQTPCRVPSPARVLPRPIYQTKRYLEHVKVGGLSSPNCEAVHRSRLPGHLHATLYTLRYLEPMRTPWEGL